MEMGHGQRRSVLILWLWTALLSAVVLYPVLTESDVSYIPIGAAAVGSRPVHRAAPGDPPAPQQRHLTRRRVVLRRIVLRGAAVTERRNRATRLASGA